MRGTGQLLGQVKALEGITPACAGNSKSRSRPGASCPDHPRVCGEQDIANSGEDVSQGSPPRVRGTVILPDL